MLSTLTSKAPVQGDIAPRYISEHCVTYAPWLGAVFVCDELYELIDDKKNIEAYKNGLVKLALLFIGPSEPIARKMDKVQLDRLDALEPLRTRERSHAQGYRRAGASASTSLRLAWSARASACSGVCSSARRRWVQRYLLSCLPMHTKPHFIVKAMVSHEDDGSSLWFCRRTQRVRSRRSVCNRAYKSNSI